MLLIHLIYYTFTQKITTLEQKLKIGTKQSEVVNIGIGAVIK